MKTKKQMKIEEALMNAIFDVKDEQELVAAIAAKAEIQEHEVLVMPDKTIYIFDVRFRIDYNSHDDYLLKHLSTVTDARFKIQNV